MNSKVSLAQVNKCLFTIAKPQKVVLNKKARIPAYLLSLQLSPELLEEHERLHKKSVYSSSAQIVNRHTTDELEASLLLTCINFARKQIGPKMSDCLTCGVLPVPSGAQDAEAYAQYKRDNTVCVQPFDFNSSATDGLIGAPVGVCAIPETKRASNPRDLTFEELEKLEILTGTVLDMSTTAAHACDVRIVPCDGNVDFGPVRGIVKARIWLRSTVADNGFAGSLVGRQVIAVTNLDTATSDGLFAEDMAAVLTVNGTTTVEPAKPVENGYKLA